MKTAILVDGGFYTRRAQKVFGDISAKDRATELVNYCKRHLNSHGENNDLHRIFYYDCPPTSKRIYHPFLQKQVEQIILISGDSDFVSAAKLARREGIDFILDPLGAPIKPDLFEHIDGLRTCDKAYTQNVTAIHKK